MGILHRPVALLSLHAWLTLLWPLRRRIATHAYTPAVWVSHVQSELGTVFDGQAIALKAFAPLVQFAGIARKRCKIMARCVCGALTLRRVFEHQHGDANAKPHGVLGFTEHQEAHYMRVERSEIGACVRAKC